jgi:hypothetical protein
MISKAEREKDKAICEAATAGEWQECGHSVFVAGSQGEPRADWVANVWYPRLPHDRAAIANAVNRLPVYIADAEEMERRIAKIETLAPLRAGTLRDEGAVLDMVLDILLGEP